MAAMLRAFGSQSSVTQREEVDQRPGRILDRQLAELDGLGEDDLLLGGQQGDLADLLEVHAYRVVDADEVGGERLEILLPLLRLGGRLGGGARGNDLLFLFLVGLAEEGRLIGGIEDLDARLFGRCVQLLEGAHLRLGLRDRLEDLVVGDEPFLATACQQVGDRRALPAVSG